MSVHRKLVLRPVLLLLSAGVVAAMVVPYSVIEALLRKFAWIGRAVDFLDTVAPGLEMTHLLAFAALGILARLGWPAARPLHVAIGILAVAATVELAQIWAPGRNPAVFHTLLETLGGLVGYAVAVILSYAWGPHGLPDDYKPSTHWTGEHRDR